jgi:hypothetical protein
LYMLLAITSVVFLESESLGTRDHILLSQILDFPIRCLLQLAGSRWKYSTSPPRANDNIVASFKYLVRTSQKTPMCVAVTSNATVITRQRSNDRHCQLVINQYENQIRTRKISSFEREPCTSTAFFANVDPVSLRGRYLRHFEYPHRLHHRGEVTMRVHSV